MHDQNFKNLVLDYPHQALAFFAPQEARPNIAQARIIPIRQEQLKERLGDRFRELDVPLLVEWPDGERTAIVFVIEEESQTCRFSIHRLAHYCLDLAELMATDRVVPVVIFLNDGSKPNSLNLGSEQLTYLQFNYLACDLKRLPAKDYQDSDNIVARLNLPNMRYAKEERLQIYAAAQLGLVQFEKNADKQSKYVDFIDYYANLSEQEIDEYRTRYLNDQGEIMGLAQILRQEGRQEGKQEGKQEGEAFALQKLLTKRFGMLPAEMIVKIVTASLDDIERWFDRAIDAQHLSDVFDR
jgi:hypothetical protein